MWNILSGMTIKRQIKRAYEYGSCLLYKIRWHPSDAAQFHFRSERRKKFVDFRSFFFVVLAVTTWNFFLCSRSTSCTLGYWCRMMQSVFLDRLANRHLTLAWELLKKCPMFYHRPTHCFNWVKMRWSVIRSTLDSKSSIRSVSKRHQQPQRSKKTHSTANTQTQLFVFDWIVGSAAVSVDQVKPKVTPDVKNMNFILRIENEDHLFALTQPELLWNDGKFNRNHSLVVFVTGWTTNYNESENSALDLIYDAYRCRGNVNFVVSSTLNFHMTNMSDDVTTEWYEICVYWNRPLIRPHTWIPSTHGRPWIQTWLVRKSAKHLPHSPQHIPATISI